MSGQLGAVELTNGTGTNQVVFDPQNPVLGESAVDNANDVSGGIVLPSFDMIISNMLMTLPLICDWPGNIPTRSKRCVDN